MSDATREFAGIPISGDFNDGYSRPEQYKLEDFLPIFNAVVQNTHVVRFGWHQYTPYFNDGDECVFGASDVWIETDADDVGKDEENDDYYSHSEWYSMDYGDGYLAKHDWNGPGHTKVYANNEPWVAFLREQAYALSGAVEGGHFDNVLLDNFGNHVEVTVYPREASPRIELETYSHD